MSDWEKGLSSGRYLSALLKFSQLFAFGIIAIPKQVPIPFLLPLELVNEIRCQQPFVPKAPTENSTFAVGSGVAPDFLAA